MSVCLCDQGKNEPVKPNALLAPLSYCQFLKRCITVAGSVAAIPLLLPYVLTTQRALIRQDVPSWLKALRISQSCFLFELLQLLGHYPEFRTLYYHRLRYGNLLAAALSVVFRFFYPGQTALYLECPEIGSGLFLQHAFSTTVGAESIGRNC